MSGNEVLSREEIDALLRGVDSGTVSTDDELRLRDGVARSIDLTSHERIVRGGMPTLEMIGNRFIRNLRVSLFNLLRRSVDVTFQGVRMLKFSEYIHSLQVPTSLNLVRMPPLRGTALFVLDANLVFALVNTYFGGDSKINSHIQGREFTAMENRVIQMTLERAFRDMEDAWAPVLPVKFDHAGTELNPQFANIVSPTEVVVVSSYSLDLEGESGCIHLTIPYAMVEPIRELLDAGMQSDRTDRDERWAVSIREELQIAEVEVHATLVDLEVKLGTILALKPGDILPMDLPETVVCFAENVPLARGTLGVSNGRNAIQVLTVLSGQQKR